MIKAWPSKDPNAIAKPYWFDWRPWLTVEEETLASYAVAIDEGGDALTIASHSNAAGLIVVRLSGGTLGVVYTVRCRITCGSGRVEDMSRSIVIVEQ
jgi:hypothetical protein